MSRPQPIPPNDWASGPSAVEQGLESAKLDAGIGRGESPADFRVFDIALRFPSGRLPIQLPDVCDAAIQTLAAEHREFDLGHVQPRAMLGGVVNLQSVGNSLGLLRW